MNRKTVFSSCRLYRYTLWRQWCDLFEESNPYVMFIGLNPSTADETEDDPTIRRCKAFAKAWGYSSMCMTNLFAWRATDPSEMLKQPNPVGEGNRHWILNTASKAGPVVAAWGTKGRHMSQDLNAREWLKSISATMTCIRITKGGHPEHPLYLPKHLTPVPFLEI